MASSVGSSADTAKFGLSSDSDKLPQVPALPASSRTLESDSSDREGIGGKLVVITTRAPSIRRSSSSRKTTPTRTTSSTPRIQTKHRGDQPEGQRSSSINKRISCETLIPGQTKGTIAEKGEITEVVAPEVSNGNQSGAVQRGSSRKRAAPEDQTAQTEVNDKEVRGSTRKWAAPDSSSLTPQGPGGDLVPLVLVLLLVPLCPTCRHQQAGELMGLTTCGSRKLALLALSRGGSLSKVTPQAHAGRTRHKGHDSLRGT